MDPSPPTYVVFVGTRRIARGDLEEVVLAAKRRHDRGTDERIALFDERTGQPIDMNLGRSGPELVRRLTERLAPPPPPAPPKRGRGRPKLGIVSREVSLLPRHWEWLGHQRGGASASLRRLVDAARKNGQHDEVVRRAVERTHRFLWDMAGDLPGFEDATRALFARDFATFDKRTSRWPVGIREQVQRLLRQARPAAPKEAT